MENAHVQPQPRTRAWSYGARVQRAFLWLYLVAALCVAAGVMLQAFSIAAYVRGAGESALDLHETGGFVTHSVEIIVFLTALVGCWRRWRAIGLALLLPIVGTLQLIFVGDTDKSGGWVNGLHGLFALVVLLLAVMLIVDAKRALS